MATFVVSTGSVHASAALCDYLDGRLGEGDAVHAAAWLPDGAGEEATRDAEDALNGVRSRLGVRASVSVHRLDGDSDGPAATDGFLDELRALADRVDAGELVVGSGGGAGVDPEAIGSLVAAATRPVVAVPLGGR